MSSDVAATASRPVLILLCTYNEVRNLPRLIEQLQVAVPPADILVVDDDSPDGTGHWVRQQSVSDPDCFSSPDRANWAWGPLPVRACSGAWTGATSSFSIWTPTSVTVRPTRQSC